MSTEEQMKKELSEARRKLESMQYKVIRSKSARDLAEQVNAALEAGWRPWGGVSMTGYRGDYAQALVREEDDE